MKNHIVDITLGAEVLSSLTTAAGTLNTAVTGFGINLDGAERKHSQKIGTRNENFARDMMEFATQRPDLIPAGMNLPALQRDLTARDQLTPLLFQLKALVSTLEDTHTALGIDLFNGTRAMYKAAQPIAEIHGVKDVLDRIGLRFARPPRKKKAPVQSSIDSSNL